jgi:hypothetical protein
MSVRTYGVRTCQWQGCGEEFTATRANQVYCKAECTRKASNQKIIDRYHENKAIKARLDRVCDKCGARLSRYNMDTTCSPCQQAKKEQDRIDFLRRIGIEYIDEG